MLDPVTTAVVGVAAILAGGAVAYFLSAQARAARAIRRSRRFAVAEFPDGVVGKIVGLARLGGELPERPLRILERVVTDGQAVAVSGLGRWEASDAGAEHLYREADQQLVLRQGGRRAPLVVQII